MRCATTPLTLLLMLPGCLTVRPVSNRGHDLIENPGRSVFVRVPAGIGALVGYTAALPVAVLLYPTYFVTDLAVKNADGYGSPPATPGGSATILERNEAGVGVQAALMSFAPSGVGQAVFTLWLLDLADRNHGDIHESWAHASFDYGAGMGAAVLGWPFAACEGLITGPPPPPPGTVDETPELPPWEEDPQLSFAVNPSAEVSPEPPPASDQP